MRHPFAFILRGLILLTLTPACSDNAGQTSPVSAAANGNGGDKVASGSGGGSSSNAGSSTEEAMPEASVSAPDDAGSAPSDATAAPNPFGDATLPSGKSAGCGMAVSDDPNKWVEHDLMVKVDPEYAAMYTSRKYFTRVPKNYDPTKAYPVTFWGHGCGATGAESTPLMGGGAADNSIQVFLLAVGGCFSTSHANSPEIPYFDAALAGIEANYCVDKSKVFLAGFSSGGWLSYLLGCARAGVIRAIGASSGGFQVDRPTCEGPTAAILTADTIDTTNPIVNIDKSGVDKGTGAARDNLLKRNGCSTETKPWAAGMYDSSCVEYQGCLPGYSVVWCQTTGYGHSDGSKAGISTKGFWQFWSSLP
jgi:poly(3-hydroxybutyrate) depolymerase